MHPDLVMKAKETKGSQFDSYSLLDLFEREQYQQLIQMCKENGIEFMSTPFDAGPQICS